MKYLVTGGAGFIGSHLIELLRDQKHEVVCIDDLSFGHLSNLECIEEIQFIERPVQEVIEIPQVDGIFHLAAQASVPKSIEDFYESSSNNLLGTLKVFDWARRFDIPVVYASSSAIYGNLPVGDEELNKFDILSPYAQDKMTMEHYASLAWTTYHTSSIGHRFFNVYGPRQDPSSPYSGVISIFIDRIAKNLPITVNGGYQTRDFVYVKDVVKALLLSIRKLHESPTFDTLNIGTGVSITIDHLVEVLKEVMNAEPVITTVPLPFGDPEKSGGTYGKMIRLLGMNLNDLTPFDEGLAATVEYCTKDLK
jgi:UDP-glucose 4-epimerase